MSRGVRWFPSFRIQRFKEEDIKAAINNRKKPHTVAALSSEFPATMKTLKKLRRIKKNCPAEGFSWKNGMASQVVISGINARTTLAFPEG